MARITVEDCLDKVDNRFQLVMISSKRARQIQTGGKDPHVSIDNDKPTVLALREIAEGHIDASILIEKPTMGMSQPTEDVQVDFTSASEDQAETKAEEGETAPEGAEAAADDAQTEADESTDAEAQAEEPTVDTDEVKAADAAPASENEKEEEATGAQEEEQDPKPSADK